jgi:hypothetical protein
MSLVGEIMARLGLVPSQAERGLLLVGDDPSAFAAVRDLVAALKARDSRFHLLVGSAVPAAAAQLRTILPDVEQVAMPYGNPVSGDVFLRRLNIRLAVLLESPERTASAALLASLRRQAITVVTVSARGAGRIDPQAPAARASERLVVIGNPATHSVPEGLPLPAVTDLLAAMMARDLKPLRQENSPLLAPARSLVRLSREPEGRRVLAWRFRRLTSVDELQERLGHPRTILCLGNGPSSESEALKRYPHDALFRVNHSWLKRPAFNRPDVVFTGGGPTMRAVSGAIFGLQAVGAEVRLASTRGLNPLSRGCTFFNVHDLTGSLEAFDWGHLRPTNGASMLTVAVALAPARLIIAGIDLFQHPEGSYPGDSASANAYAPGHSRETELEYILGLLGSYRGELVIVGDVLAAAWEAHQAVLPRA